MCLVAESSICSICGCQTIRGAAAGDVSLDHRDHASTFVSATVTTCGRMICHAKDALKTSDLPVAKPCSQVGRFIHCNCTIWRDEIRATNHGAASGSSPEASSHAQLCAVDKLGASAPVIGHDCRFESVVLELHTILRHPSVGA
jgi:hypothetical protein